jgi:hypothetical protein
MDWRTLKCTVCRVRFWHPKHGKLHSRVTIAKVYYCERCAKHKRKLEAADRSCAIRKGAWSAGRIVVVKPFIATEGGR